MSNLMRGARSLMCTGRQMHVAMHGARPGVGQHPNGPSGASSYAQSLVARARVIQKMDSSVVLPPLPKAIPYYKKIDVVRRFLGKKGENENWFMKAGKYKSWTKLEFSSRLETPLTSPGSPGICFGTVFNVKGKKMGEDILMVKTTHLRWVRFDDLLHSYGYEAAQEKTQPLVNAIADGYMAKNLSSALSNEVELRRNDEERNPVKMAKSMMSPLGLHGRVAGFITDPVKEVVKEVVKDKLEEMAMEKLERKPGFNDRRRVAEGQLPQPDPAEVSVMRAQRIFGKKAFSRATPEERSSMMERASYYDDEALSRRLILALL